MIPECNSSAVADLVRLGQKLSTGELQAQAFNVHGVTTRVVTNSSAVARAVAKLLRPFPANLSGQPQIEVHLFAVAKITAEMAPVPATASMMYDWDMVQIYHQAACRYLMVDHRARVQADVAGMAAVGFASDELLDSDWLISHLFFYPLWAQLLKEAGLFPLHAAGLAKERKGFLFPGRSGSGKSTLILNMVRAGYGLLSDDTVFLRLQDGRVEALSFPEEINIKEETIELIPELSRVKNFTVNDLRQKSSFSIEELYPGCVVEKSTPAVVVFPEITDNDATVVEPMSRTEALALSMRYGFFFVDPSTTGRHFEILSQLARQAECYRLYSGRNQEELERVINALLTVSPESSGEDTDD